MSATALAGSGSLSGKVLSFTNASEEGSFPFGYDYTNLSWRVDLFVSGREDGTLDPSIDSIKSSADQSISDASRYVGSLLYTQIDLDTHAAFIQATNSTFYKNRSLAKTILNDYRTTIYNLPYMEKIEPDDETYGSGNNMVYIVKEAAPNGLPMNIDAIGSNYTLVQDIVSTPEFTSAIVNELSAQMGTGASLLAKLGICLDDSIKSKVKSNSDLVANLLPTSDNPLVEWCCVVSPMLQYNANVGYTTSMWFINDSDYMTAPLDIFSDDTVASPTIVTPRSVRKADGTSRTATLILDAYGSGQYNHITKNTSGAPSVYQLQGLHDKLVAAGVAITDQRMEAYETYGVLSKEYGSLFKNIATASIVNEEVNPYFGIYCSSTSTVWDDTTMANQGGIGIYVTKKGEGKQIPVYYYVTPTPDNPVQTTPTSVSVDKPFIPNPPPGTAVDEVIIPDKLIGYSTSENPPGHYPTGYSVSQYIVPKNPDGTYPIKPKDPPYILVKCVAAVPVYYHTFTFTNTTGTSYSNVIDFLKDNPDVTESDTAESIVLQDSAPSLAATKSSTYTPTSNNSIVAIVSTSGSADGISWKQLMSQGEAGNRYGSY